MYISQHVHYLIGYYLMIKESDPNKHFLWGLLLKETITGTIWFIFIVIGGQITQDKCAWPFMHPVDVEGLGLHDYYKVRFIASYSNFMKLIIRALVNVPCIVICMPAFVVDLIAFVQLNYSTLALNIASHFWTRDMCMFLCEQACRHDLLSL